MKGDLRTKPVPEEKLKVVSELVDKLKKSHTVLLASCKGLPGGQFHSIKKKIRDKAEMRVVKKSAFERAIKETGKGSLQELKKVMDSDIVLLFSDIDAFELSGVLTESQSPRKAKAGEIALKDIEIEPGPTDLVPGPAISELSGVGLKVSVKEGKLEIQKGAIVAKEGEPIKENVASVLGKLNILPMKAGFIPVAAYDSKEDKVYLNILIDKEGTINELKDQIRKSLGFAAKISYPTRETVSYFIAKASMEEKVLDRLVNTQTVEKEEMS